MTISTKQTTISRLVYNTGFSFAAVILARMAHVILFILVSRLSGVAEVGVLTIGLSYLIIANQFAAWGLDQILVRDVARDPALVGKYFANFLFLRLILAVGVAAILAGLFIFQPYPLESLWLIYLIILNVIPEGILNLSQAVFMAHQRMIYVTMSGALVGGLKLLFSVGALLLGYGIRGVVVGLLLANILATVGTFIFTITKFTTWEWSFDLRFSWAQLKLAVPFIFLAGVLIINAQLGTLLLSWQVDQEQVGLYGGVMTLFVGIAFIPRAYRDAIFPLLSSAFADDTGELRVLYRQSYKYLLLLAVPVTLGLFTLAEPILIWLYRPEFAAATLALRITAFIVFIPFLSMLHNRLLIVANQQAKIARYLALGLVVNLILNLTLVPVWGIAGAALGRLVADSLSFTLIYITFRQEIHAFAVSSLWVRPLVAGGVMVGVILRFNTWPVWALIGVGATVYGLTLLLLGTFSRQELVTWLRVFKLDKLAGGS